MTKVLEIYAICLIAGFMFLSCTIGVGEDKSSGFSWTDIEQAQKKASDDGKKILISVYTDWCEYCRKFEKTVYKDSLVRASMAQYYHATRLNAESDSLITFNGKQTTERELASEMGIRSYPTILFLDYNGDLILQINGYMPAEDFTKMLAFIGEEAFQRTEFHEFAAERSRR